MEIQKMKNDILDNEEIEEIVAPVNIKKTKVKEKADGRTQTRTKKQLETLEKMRKAKQAKAEQRAQDFEEECKKIEDSDEEEVKPPPKPKRKPKNKKG